ncbi:MAG: hypothetical protein RIF41_32165 [Polyangiaceae bacterium]
MPERPIPTDGTSVLSDVLKQLGWRHEPSETHGKRDIYDADGKLVGAMSCFECWDHLRAEGLVVHRRSA